MKQTKKQTDRKDNVIDLTVKAPEIKYICKVCNDFGNDLLPYPQAKQKNPHIGKPYVCAKCGHVYDLDLEKLPRATKSVSSNIKNEDTFFLTTISENKGLNPVEDQYRKYDPEPDADQHLINSGATIIDSRITLTDSHGQNRTVVKRDYPGIRPVNMFD